MGGGLQELAGPLAAGAPGAGAVLADRLRDAGHALPPGDQQRSPLGWIELLLTLPGRDAYAQRQLACELAGAALDHCVYPACEAAFSELIATMRAWLEDEATLDDLRAVRQLAATLTTFLRAPQPGELPTHLAALEDELLAQVETTPLLRARAAGRAAWWASLAPPLAPHGLALEPPAILAKVFAAWRAAALPAEWTRHRWFHEPGDEQPAPETWRPFLEALLASLEPGVRRRVPHG